jgi:hypothetical protein
MKKRTIVSLSCIAITALAFSAGAADPKETVSGAVKALKEKGNYTWSSTSEMANSQFPATTTKGRTEKNGFTLITMETQNGEMQAVKKGTNGVVKSEDGWKTAEEARQGGQGPGRGFGSRLLTTPVPADDFEALLGELKEIKAGSNNVYSADLTEQGAKSRASFGRRGPRGGGGATPPEPKDAKGSVQFWVKDGALTKVELKTSAKITFQEEERLMERTTTIDISNVGSTKVEVPEEARKKLM